MPTYTFSEDEVKALRLLCRVEADNVDGMWSDLMVQSLKNVISELNRPQDGE
jgi:hypothetical protein